MSTYCAEVLSPAADRGDQPGSGLPGVAERESAPDVKVLLISQRPEGFFLERFNERREFVGSTRHDEMDDAMREAWSQYGSLSDWRLCPDGTDPLEYIRSRSRS